MGLHIHQICILLGRGPKYVRHIDHSRAFLILREEVGPRQSGSVKVGIEPRRIVLRQ
jgi:hypothetical protein